MLHKLTLPTVLITSLLLGACMRLPEVPPMLAGVEKPVVVPTTS
jgi:hypothetical protein